MKQTELTNRCCSLCTHSRLSPCRHLITCIEEGPVCHDSSDCRDLRIKRREHALRGGVETLIFVGAATCGLANGAGEVIRKINSFIKERNLQATVIEVGCIGYCQREVFVDIQRGHGPRISYCDISPDNIDEFLLETFVNGNWLNKYLFGRHEATAHFVDAFPAPAQAAAGSAADGSAEAEGEAKARTAASTANIAVAGAGLDDELAAVPLVSAAPFFAKQKKNVLKKCGIIDPTSLDAALAYGAFKAASRALTSMTPAEVCEEVTQSGLQGRGGAGFPTGRKWKMALDQVSSEKYIICNADEGDPGAFMDRAVLEGDPFRVIEGILIAAYAIGANKGYIYCRAEYPLAIKRLNNAIEQCRHAGLLGDNILDSLFSFDVKVKKGAGAFVCGEETAIIASIEGCRGMPRNRPPYPAVSGLHKKPTILNNVETLANVASILVHGPQWFKNLGIGGRPGTKVFALSGAISNTGLVEVPVGTPLREILYDIGGGALPGHRIKAVQIGGPSGGCIPEQHLDVPVDYQDLIKKGAMMGSGGMVVMDERTCMVDLAKFFMDFIKNESCGKCTPCREGTTRMHEILTAFTSRPVGDEIARLNRFEGILYLEELAQTIKDTALCGLGNTSGNPILSTLRYFRDEYEAHVLANKCPAGACKGLRTYKIDTGLCIGCSICKKKCASDAIVGERKQAHYILTDRCVGCGACVSACPKDAIWLEG